MQRRFDITCATSSNVASEGAVETCEARWNHVAAVSDDRVDPLGSQPIPECRRVVAAIGQDRVAPPSWMAEASGYWRDRFDQFGRGLDVRHVARGRDDREWDARGVAGDVVLGAGPTAIYRRT